VRTSSGPCDVPPCSREAALELRFLVDGQPAVLAACRAHASWLTAYAHEDNAVLLLGEDRWERPPRADGDAKRHPDDIPEGSWRLEEGYG